MVTFDANYWDDNFKPSKPLKTLPKRLNNERMVESAELHVDEMRDNPSYLEKMMQQFLDNHNVKYEFQKIFYIRDKSQCIKQYYIVDFYIPTRNLVIEMDGKFHKNQKAYDSMRTQTLKQHYRKIKVIRLTYKDMCSQKKLQDVLNKLGIK